MNLNIFFFLKRDPQVSPDPQRSPWHEKG